MVRFAGVRPGQRVLDVGCGPGGLTELVAAVVGGDRVAAIEPSEEFAEACRERVPGADVRLGAGEALPFEGASFDIVLSQLVLPLMLDPRAGVCEMARVVRPGGTVAACAWREDAMPYLAAVWNAADAVAPELAPPAGDSGRVGYESAEGITVFFQAAGLVQTETAELEAGARYEDFDDLWAPLAAGAGQSGRLVASLDDDRRAAMREETWRNLGAPEGPFTLRASAWAARGQRAA